MLSTLVILLCHLFAFASARYYVISPLQNTTWAINQPATVQWRITAGGPVANFITVDLVAGSPSNFRWVATICEQLPADAVSCTWSSVPSFLPTLPSGYSVRIGYNNPPSEDFDYSPQFQINGAFAGSETNLPRQPAPSECLASKCTNSTTSTSNLPSLGKDPRSLPSSSKREVSLDIFKAIIALSFLFI